MSAHLRNQIRDAVVSLLRGARLTGARVYPTRRFPLQPEHLPALLVYTLAEDAGPETIGSPRFLSRDLDLVIEGVAQDNDTLDGLLDSLADVIETRLGAALEDPASALRGLVRTGALQRTEIVVRPPQQPDEAGTGHIVLTYRVNYRTRSNDPKLNT